MSEEIQEKRAKILAKLKGEDSSTSTDNSGRERAAQQWVSHFNSVLDLIDTLDEVPETNEGLAAALVASWEENAKAKDTKLVDRVKRLKA